MILKQIPTGGDRNLAYIVADETSRKAAIIDPSYDPERVYRETQQLGLSIAYVFNTHAHHDHTNGNAEIEKLSGIQALKFGDTDPVTGKEVTDDAQFPLGDLTLTILHTPGHTSDSICLHIGDAVLTGDTLFVGKVGGTDFGENARREFDSLHGKLLTLPDETRVFPGHDVGIAPESTIGHERQTNPFLIQPDFEAFVDLKRNWLAYKQKHGIA